MERISRFINFYFVEKTENSFVQFFRYIFVGGFATVVDIGSLYILVSRFNFYYLFAAAISFLLGITVNYIVSIFWIFQSKGNTKKEVSFFIAIGLGGLVLNQFAIWLIVSKMGIYFMLAKVISTTMVLFWNFGMRKKFVF